MEQMNKFTLIPSAQQYKSAPANDQEISISYKRRVLSQQQNRAKKISKK